jgi:C-terminal processing protease CtpA/Prc
MNSRKHSHITLLVLTVALTLTSCEAAKAEGRKGSPRAWLGIDIQTLTPEQASSLGLADPSGALIRGVAPGSPAEEAGLKDGDILLKADQAAIGNAPHMAALVNERMPGDKMALLIWREGKTIRRMVQLAAHPEQSLQGSFAEFFKSPPKAWHGISIQNITPELASFLGLAKPAGVLIQSVAPGSPAEEAELKRGDVILEADQMAIRDWTDMVALVNQKMPGEELALLIWREGKTFGQMVRLASIPSQPLQGRSTGAARTMSADPGRTTESVQRPSLKIQRIEVSPIRVKAGADFDLKVEYIASDPASGTGEIPVQFSYSICEKGKSLHNQPELTINAPNGAATGRVEHLKASSRKGDYSIKVVLRYQGSAIEESINFTIE